MIKMIAQRLHYNPDDGKEYKVGETFNVANEREADRLERRRRAERALEMAKPAHVDAPKHSQKMSQCQNQSRRWSKSTKTQSRSGHTIAAT